MLSPRGFTVNFSDTLPESVHIQVRPVAVLPPHGLPGYQSVSSDDVQITCYGEMLSYRSDGDTAACLQQVMTDWQNDTVQYDRLNGRFVLFIWDKQAEAWTIITDRIGAMHVYWVRRDNRVVVIGSDLATVADLASEKVLDWEAIAGFFNFGFFLDDRTYYQDVRILYPASIYRISAHGDVLEVKPYWQWFHRVDTSRSYADTINEYHRLLNQAVQRTMKSGRAVLPVSGGLDSRSLAMMMPGGSKAYSYGYTRDSIETHIAAQIAQARKFDFTAFTIRPYLFDNILEIAHALHGSQDIVQARQIFIRRWLQTNGDSVLSGLWGDVWCDQMGLADGVPEGTTAAAHAAYKMQKNGSKWLLDHVIAPQLAYDDVRAFLWEWVAKGIAQYDHIEDADFRVKAFKTAQWAFRWSNAAIRAFELGAVPRVPYYDVDLVDFFCTVPTEFVRDRRIQIDHIKQYAPELARIRWQQAGANLYLAEYGYWLGLPRRAVKKAYRQLTKTPVIQRNWEVQFFSPNGREQLNRWLMNDDLKLREFVPARVVGSLLDELYTQPAAGTGYTTSMLLSFSTWLEVVR